MLHLQQENVKSYITNFKLEKVHEPRILLNSKKKKKKKKKKNF